MECEDLGLVCLLPSKLSLWYFIFVHWPIQYHALGKSSQGDMHMLKGAIICQVLQSCGIGNVCPPWLYITYFITWVKGQVDLTFIVSTLRSHHSVIPKVQDHLISLFSHYSFSILSLITNADRHLLLAGWSP